MPAPDGHIDCYQCEGRGYIMTPQEIQRRRVAAGVSIEALAEVTGLAMSTLTDMLRGRTIIRPASERRILAGIAEAKLLGMTTTRARTAT